MKQPYPDPPFMNSRTAFEALVTRLAGDDTANLDLRARPAVSGAVRHAPTWAPGPTRSSTRRRSGRTAMRRRRSRDPEHASAPA